MTVREALLWATNKLSQTSSSPALDAEVLLSHILKKDRAWLFANPDCNFSKLPTTHYQLLTTRRHRGVPVAYLTGHKEFYGLDFLVTPDVLTPRPETELLVERALEILKAKSYNLKAIIDIGTGSGCIIISIAKNLPVYAGLDQHTPRFYATDISKKALAIAHANARAHGVAGKIKFLRGNLLALLKPISYKLTPVLILANLPYLTPQQYNSNPDLHLEPRSALIAGKNGLKYYRELFSQLSVILSAKREESQRFFGPSTSSGPQDDKIIILLEHDPSQVASLKSLTKKYFPKIKLKFHKDLSCRFRVLEIKI